MSTSRLFKSFAALATVVVLALPVASAFAMPSIDVSGSHLSSSSRAVYYAAKERQFEMADVSSLRSTSRVRQARRSVAPASANRYAAAKEKQAEFFMR